MRLPHRRTDAARQLLMFAVAYAGYELVRGLVTTSSSRALADATRIIDFERALHVFVEPRMQSWATTHAHWLLDIADWTYLNAHFALTAAAMVFIYLRRNDSFYFVRNMFMVAILIALIGYSVYPTAPPRLMPQWGFSDSIRQFTGIDAQQGAAGLLLNPYAAVPSMHVCFALMIALPMSALVHSGVARVLWRVYPLFIVFVVVVTGNHYFTDVALGALTAATAAALAKQLLARARPDVWAFAVASTSRSSV
ncbi:MAG: phosphatase PAP2 family protein [Solirubrobacteraceae bacterium]